MIPQVLLLPLSSIDNKRKLNARVAQEVEGLASKSQIDTALDIEDKNIE